MAYIGPLPAETFTSFAKTEFATSKAENKPTIASPITLINLFIVLSI